MALCRTGEVPLYYDDSGQGHPVLLIHGHSVDARLWDPQVSALTAARFRVIRYDLRGHGRSDKPQRGYTLAHHLADLRALIGHLGVGPLHLVGLSLGGGIALAYALDHPERVSALALLAPALPGFAYSDEFSQSIIELRDAVRQEGPQSALERLWLAHPIFTTLRRHPDAFERVRFMMRSYSAADYLVDEEPLEMGVLERLSQVPCPTLVLVGEEDLPDFRLITELLAQNVPSAKKVVIPGAGHVVNLEAVEAVNQALVEFLREVTPSR